MNELIICLIIAFSIVYITDWVGFWRTATSRILSLIRGKEITVDRVKLPYILECSLCQTNWVTLIVLLFMNWKLCWMCLVFSYLTKPILYLFNIIDMIIDKIYSRIYGLIKR